MLSLYIIRSSHRRCSMKKGVPENFAKFTGKHLYRPQTWNFINKETLAHAFSCEFCKIYRNPFFTEHLRMTASAFSSFAATLLRLGTANRVWKTSDEYSLSRNTNLRKLVQVYHFFLGSINFQYMFSLVYTVYCQKLPPEVFCKKSVLKNFVNSQENTCVGVFIKKRLKNTDVFP